MGQTGNWGKRRSDGGGGGGKGEGRKTASFSPFLFLPLCCHLFFHPSFPSTPQSAPGSLRMMFSRQLYFTCYLPNKVVSVPKNRAWISPVKFMSDFIPCILCWRYIDGGPPAGEPDLSSHLWRRYSEFELLRNYLVATYPPVSYLHLHGNTSLQLSITVWLVA